MINKDLSVRFYIRPSARSNDLDTPTPLRLKVWIAQEKRYIYSTTDVVVTPRQWKQFTFEGKPTNSADPKIARQIKDWVDAAFIFTSCALAYNRVSDLTSELFLRRLHGIVGRIRTTRETGVPQPIFVFMPPTLTPICKDCVFCEKRCKAPWFIEAEVDAAADFAIFNGFCRNRVVKEDGKYYSFTTPNVPSSKESLEATNLFGLKYQDLLKAVEELQEGGQS